MMTYETNRTYETNSGAGPTVFEASRPACGVGLVAIRGEVDLHSVGAFRDVLQGLIGDTTCLAIVLDARGMPYLDSAGLGVIVDAVRRLRDREGDGRLFLTAAVPFVRRAFEITRIARILTLCDTVDEALVAAGKMSSIEDKCTAG